MKNRLLLRCVAAFLCILAAFVLDRRYKDTQLLQQYAADVSAYLAEQETEAREWVRQSRPAIQNAASGRPLTAAWATTLESQASKDYSVLVHRGDSILFWSNNKALPQAGVLNNLSEKAGRTLLQLPFGYYLVTTESFDSDQLSILIPVRYTLETRSANRLFPAGKWIPADVVIASYPTPYAISSGGKALAWLETPGALQAIGPQWTIFILYALGLLFALLAINHLALRASARFGPLTSMAIVLASAGGLLFLNAATHFTAEQFHALPLFAPRFDSASLMGRSLGDWLLHVVLLLWIMVHFHRSFKAGPMVQLPLPIRFVLASAGYFFMMSSVWATAVVLRHLVYDSGIDFDFDNLLKLDNSGFLALAGIILLQAALFLFSHRLMLSILRLQLSTLFRAAALVLSALLLGVVCLQTSLPVSPVLLVGFAAVYAGVFDFFSDWKTPGFGWILLWLLLFSGFSASLLYRYNEQKDKSTRQAYAEALANDRDTAMAEPLLRKFQQEMQADTQLARLLKPWPFKPETERVRNHLNAIAYRENYLFQHYKLTVYVFDQDNQPLLLEQSLGRTAVVDENWTQGLALPGTTGIRCLTGPDGVFRYMTYNRLNRMQDPTQPVDIYCFFDHVYSQATRVYAELFYQQPYKNMGRLQGCDFAVFRNGRLVVEQGQGSPVTLAAQLAKGQSREVETANPRRVHTLYRSADGNTLVAVGQALGVWYKQVYLFAILFTLASLCVFGLAVLNSYLHLLPENYGFLLTTKGSLARRIHYSNVTLVALAFLVIGVMTYQHFTASSQQTERANLDYRAEAMLTNLRMQLGALSPGSDSLRRALPQSLSALAASLSMDANLYAPDGSMVFTTREDLRQLGILPAKMAATAYESLLAGGQAELVAAEQVAGNAFFTKYMPLRNRQNELLAFLGVPYDLTERQAGPEVSDFLGMLASLYVFLLLIAVSATLLLARSITRPVNLISEKIKELQFEDKNQPLDYQGDPSDELGGLIAEYNRMVDKLEDSKKQLIRLEREGAWREMARQIAHDIKNPLTTMKLSMQQLERVADNPEQASAYLKKATVRLIEQIDSLAQTASEFSMFANLDIRQKNDMVVNDVVESVYDLFTEQKDADLDLSLPDERLHIKGDKNHLLRVFNNLVINAIQAIPSDRRGHIRVSLRRENNEAVVQIGDNGGGIPPEIQQRVFEPNFTTKTSGSGLGLAICRKIIEAHEGNIGFETRENEGTDFFIRLPLNASDMVE